MSEVTATEEGVVRWRVRDPRWLWLRHREWEWRLTPTQVETLKKLNTALAANSLTMAEASERMTRTLALRPVVEEREGQKQ